MRKVVCGVGTSDDPAPVRAAAELARAADATLVLMHCLPPLRLRLGGDERHQRRRALRYARALPERIGRELETRQPIRIQVALEKPSDGLRRVAAHEDTVALVIGTGRGRVLGDVTSEVAATAAAPVIIVPSGSDSSLSRPRCVVAGYDGAPPSRAALRSVAGTFPHCDRFVIGTASTKTEGHARGVVPLGPGLAWRRVHEPAGEALSELAEEARADLVAVGASRRIGTDPLLGSTVRHLCHTGQRPVLVASGRCAERFRPQGLERP